MDKEQLYRYFSFEATEEERSAIREWVEESPENLRVFMEERSFFDAATILVEEAAASETKRWRRVALSALKVAAIAVVMFSLSYVVQRSYLSPEIPMQEITVPAGQQLNLTLADGTSVWLNSNTSFRYPAVFDGDKRHVEIDGEGYFTVAKDEDCPFEVKTPRGSIEVLGTIFNVEDYSTDKLMKVDLIEGSVRLSAGGDCRNLSPGQSAELEAGGKLCVTEIDDYEAFLWTKGIISLKDDSFEEIMKKFEKFYGITISVEKENLDPAAYSGKFYQSDGVRYALKVLQHDIDFKFETDQQRHIIYIK